VITAEPRGETELNGHLAKNNTSVKPARTLQETHKSKYGAI